MTETQADKVISSIHPWLKPCLPDYRSKYLTLTRRKLYKNLCTYCDKGGVFTGEVVGEDYVFYHHTEDGKIEVYRDSVLEVSECVGWIVTVCDTCFCLLFSAIGLGFAVTKLVPAIVSVVRTNSRLLNDLSVLIENSESEANLVIKVMKWSYTGGILGKILGAVLTGSWWSIAINSSLVILSVASLCFTGGLYTVIVIAEVSANIRLLIYTLTQKPASC